MAKRKKWHKSFGLIVDDMDHLGNDHPSHGSINNNNNNKNLHVILRLLTWSQMILICVWMIYCRVNGGPSISDCEETKKF